MSWKSFLKSTLNQNIEKIGLSASYASLATVRMDNTPAVRTVVMRGFVAEHHKEETGLTSDLLVITTDKRTEKMKEIENNPNVEINWYMNGTVSQFRIRGIVYIIKKGEAPICDWDTVVSSSSIPPTTQPSLALEAFNRHKKINCWEAERLRQFIQLDAGLRRDMLDETDVRQAIEANHIRIYSCPIESEDEETIKRNKSIADAFPYAIIGSTNIVQTADGRKVRGREYSWGVAEVENEEHCDFKKLRNLLIRTHMLDLMTTTEDVHYENYRQQQMATRKFGEPKVTKKLENPKFREKEEELRKSFTAKVKAEETRFREWEQQLITERDRLNKDLETQHAQIKQLESELDKLYQQVGRSGTVRR
ncbi:Putative Peanut-like protein 1 (Cell division control like protein 1) [Rhizopus microsporus]|nr:Putative Peanut-like protein 1 (Cell division control like protein 1) [Rhizopus microsporus]